MSAQVETAQEEKVHLKSKINELYVRVRQAIRLVRHQSFKKIPSIKSKPVIVSVIAVIVIAGAIFLFRGKDGRHMLPKVLELNLIKNLMYRYVIVAEKRAVRLWSSMLVI